jgi:tetratricopeptide (TPR) repeat protein
LAEADAMTARAVALQPHNAQAHVQRSLVEYRKGLSGAWPARKTLAAALAPAREAVRLDPRLASGHGMLACIYGMLGDTDHALDAAARATELNPAAWVGDHSRAIAYAFASPEWAEERDRDAAGLIDAAETTLRKSSSAAFRSGHLFFAGLGLLLRGDAADLALPIAALERAAAAPGATWWPTVFLALAEARRGRRDVSAARITDARALLPALSLTSVGDLFGRSRIWPRWSRETEDPLPVPAARAAHGSTL